MIELVQFRHSPYNEKVRWALDLKRVPHTRRSVLPGPHLITVRRLTGRTGTPVLIHDGQAMDQSADILTWLEERYPDPPLFPADPAAKAEALRLERWFDDDIVPRVRRVVLDTLLREPSYFARVFGEGLSGLRQRAYALVLPLARPAIRKANGIFGPESVEDGHRAAAGSLDVIASRAASGDYLVGGAFSIADLTLAAGIAALVGANGSPMEFVDPAPGYRALIERYASHPGVAWMERIYARHRGARADFEGPSG